jgi:hypothetical protein
LRCVKKKKKVGSGELAVVLDPKLLPLRKRLTPGKVPALFRIILFFFFLLYFSVFTIKTFKHM